MGDIYINKVRQQLKNKKTPPKCEKEIQLKKKRVLINSDQYKSENVFVEESLVKCNQRQKTPYYPRKRTLSDNTNEKQLKVKKTSFGEVSNGSTPVNGSSKTKKSDKKVSTEKSSTKCTQRQKTPYYPRNRTLSNNCGKKVEKLNFEDSPQENSHSQKKTKAIIQEKSLGKCKQREKTPYFPRTRTLSDNIHIKPVSVKTISFEDPKSKENGSSEKKPKKYRKSTPFRPKCSQEMGFKVEKLSFNDTFEESDVDVPAAKLQRKSTPYPLKRSQSFEQIPKKRKLSFEESIEQSFNELFHSSSIIDDYDDSFEDLSCFPRDNSQIKLENVNVLSHSITLEPEIKSEVFNESFKQSEDESEEKETNINGHVDEEHSDNPSPSSILPEPQFKHHDTKTEVTLYQNTTLPVHGLFNLIVKSGEIEVLGSQLASSNRKYKFYSPKGSSLLKITAKSVEASIICSNLQEDSIKFTEKLIPQQLFPSIENSNGPQVNFELHNLNILKYDEETWCKPLKKLKSTSKLMIVGGKGVGKSTYLRYTINCLLNKHKKVRIIDLDPGQSEFTIPGSISVLTINTPLFGPNYTHLSSTEQSILVDINVANNPQQYLEAIKTLMKNINQDKCPLVVNTMGFNTGLGLNLICASIFHVQPTNLLEIISRNSKKNYQVDFQSEEVKNHAQLFMDQFPNDFKYKYSKIHSKCSDLPGWEMTSREKREICTLMYFGVAMKGQGVDSLSSHQLPMFEIQLSDIKIVNLEGDSLPLAAVVANLVALCSKEGDFFHVHGYGVIRGVDVVEGKLVLITPEDASVLEKVHFLVLTSVRLPASAYMSPGNYYSGFVPYVMSGEHSSLGLLTKRTYIPANKT